LGWFLEDRVKAFIEQAMKDKSKEWVKRFRKLEYFHIRIRDLLYFFIIFVVFLGIFLKYLNKEYLDILSRFSFLPYHNNVGLYIFILF